MALTGCADGPALGCPAPLAACAQGAWQSVCHLSPDALDPEIPAYRMLGERAALFGYERQGAMSPGGSCRLLECVDGWLAVNLPREHDWRSLPALLEHDVDTWEELATKLSDLPLQVMLDRARLMGLAVARDDVSGNVPWCRQTRCSPAAPPAGRSPLVVDLSSLWAGPLCAELLAQSGARVIKLESQTRPDGARHGNARFFDLLNARKQSVALDFDSSSGRRCLQELLKRADIVIEASRPRALRQLGVEAETLVREDSGKVWVSITGYGREEPMANWVAFGDDAGVAAGLSRAMNRVHGAPVFVGDAIADPLTGLHAAAAALAAWQKGGGVLLDISLRSVVAHCLSSGYASLDTPTAVRSPVAREMNARAPQLGANTQYVLVSLGIRC